MTAIANGGAFENARLDVDALLSSRPASEEALEEALELIGARAEDDLLTRPDLESDDERAWELLGAVDAWASLASYAFQRVYVEEPADVGSPFRRFKGARPDVMKRLRSCASRFKRPLEAACGVLGALSYSISVGFPLGLSVGVTWEPGQPPDPRA